MDLFDLLTMIGGLCLFLFGMNLMGEGLERAAGSGLRSLLSKLTSNRFLGFLTGIVVTAVIQSSSATTVMVVGFVNSGLMNLTQAIGVIMGANIGTTVTAWILSLGGIEGDNFILQLLKPTSFTPILALIGIGLQMFAKDSKKKDIASIFLGFAVLMFGMDTMSGAVKGLRNEPWFTNLFVMFTNPILGVLAGAVLTGIIQSSSASVGILQALATTGAVSYGAAIPIIMGQNIGTTVTALLSSVGTTKNARRAAILHLLFNILGTLLLLPVFWLVKALMQPAILGMPADYLGISVCHTAFNLICTLVLFPCAGLMEKLVCKLVPDDKKQQEHLEELDQRLLNTPPIALLRCREVTAEMAQVAAQTIRDGIAILDGYTPELDKAIREGEHITDHYEDILGTYMVKLSTLALSEEDNNEAAMLLRAIGDFERIGDHGMNLLEAAQELDRKNAQFSKEANRELKVLTDAVAEILELSFDAFVQMDYEKALLVEPLEEAIDGLKEKLRKNHITRLQQGNCSIETGFVWADLLTGLERIADHCSNLAGDIIDLHNHNRNTHETAERNTKGNPDFARQVAEYQKKYTV